ncbi:Auxin response [Thalictrum thalictroides]|uniref:Auxin response n=1 Tax=Thalictrum thalictroides TaxID=46969 RepID=A0A7J6VBI6_THATH|nr:Auxin response [Thalictrum thalictroides]
MAIIKEEPEDNKEAKPSNKATPQPSSSSKPVDSPTANAFMFWAYFTLFIALITPIFVFLSSLRPQDDKSWFLSLPNDLRLHYSKGRTIKVQTQPNGSPIEVFAIENGPRDAETVLLIHGLGCSSYSFRHVIRSLGFNGIHAVAIDLPGSGFSDKSSLEEDERLGGVLGRIWEVYSDIKEKGLFWGFDQLVEQGRIPYEEFEIRVSPRKSLKPLKLGSEEMGHVIGQVIDSMNLSPVHLVLHDSALGMSANWVLENAGLVSSLTLVDSTPRSVSLPLSLLGLPIVREFVLGSSFLYTRTMRFCCSRLIESSVTEAHRVLLKGRDGRRTIVGVGNDLNFTYDLGKWAGMEAVKSVPIQVLWSSNWSEEWSKEGHWVSEALPHATFIMHSGGRWPQEDAADEISDTITRFVSSLPQSKRQVEEEPLPEHIQKMFDEAKSGDHHHDHHHHGHGGHEHHHHGHGGHDGGHGHIHEPNYMDAYGLWGS